MMKYPMQLGTLVAMVAGFFINMLTVPVLDARIGESRGSLERRLLSSGGIVYRDDAIESERRKGMLYLPYLQYMPDSVDLRTYFKTSDGRRPSSSELEAKWMPEGWDMHVVYVGGKSALEVYKRSQKITDFELNQLLALHAEGSYWKLLDKEEKAELSLVSAIGPDMVRSDGRVRAKKLGSDALVLIDSVIDSRLAEMNMSELQKKAPASVEGF